MWERRLVWVSGKPRWWDGTWTAGIELLARQRRAPEERPDTYLVLPDRVDVGLKLRGGAEDDFDAKVLHARSDGWELWEKTAYPRWNALEAARFGAMIRLAGPTADAAGDQTPTAGAKAALSASGTPGMEVAVEKTRIQASAADLLARVTGHAASSGCLAELVEIRLARRSDPLFSVCLETMDPLRTGIEFPESGDALCCGYPELLVRHVRGAL